MNVLEQERFMAKIEIDSQSGCWNWMGFVDSKGYGHYRIDNKPGSAHRAALTIFKGVSFRCTNRKLAQVDHLCRNRSCVNPDHLKIVTAQQNLLRSEITIAGINARKTHCPKGHEYSEENTMVDGGSRLCRECCRIRCLKYSRRNRGTLRRIGNWHMTHCSNGHRFTKENTGVGGGR